MRKISREVIRELQKRVARLEKSSGLLPVSSEMHFKDADEVEREAIDYLKENNPGVDWDVSSVKFKRHDEDSGYVEITGRFKTEDFVKVNYQGGKVLKTMSREQPIRGCEVEYKSYEWGFIAGGDLYYDITYDAQKGSWRLENNEDKFEIESTFRTSEDIEAIVQAIKRKLR